jgi:hypothetical protein
VLVETIHKMKSDAAREKDVAAEGDARRAKNAHNKEKRIARKAKHLGEVEAAATKPAEKSEQKASLKQKEQRAAKKQEKATKPKTAPAAKPEKPAAKADKPKPKGKN